MTMMPNLVVEEIRVPWDTNKILLSTEPK